MYVQILTYIFIPTEYASWSSFLFTDNILYSLLPPNVPLVKLQGCKEHLVGLKCHPQVPPKRNKVPKICLDMFRNKQSKFVVSTFGYICLFLNISKHIYWISMFNCFNIWAFSNLTASPCRFMRCQRLRWPALAGLAVLPVSR